jgi:hypothetical protein
VVHDRRNGMRIPPLVWHVCPMERIRANDYCCALASLLESAFGTLFYVVDPGYCFEPEERLMKERNCDICSEPAVRRRL